MKAGHGTTEPNLRPPATDATDEELPLLDSQTATSPDADDAKGLDSSTDNQMAGDALEAAGLWPTPNGTKTHKASRVNEHPDPRGVCDRWPAIKPFVDDLRAKCCEGELP